MYPPTKLPSTTIGISPAKSFRHSAKHPSGDHAGYPQTSRGHFPDYQLLARLPLLVVGDREPLPQAATLTRLGGGHG